MQVDDAGKLVKDFGPPVPEDAPEPPPSEPETIIHTPPLAAAPRPSLEVETEVHAHLTPRLEAHLRRIEAWGMCRVPEDLQRKLRATLAGMRLEWFELTTRLRELEEAGFVAKTTPSTRKRVALRPGVAVKLRPDVYADNVGLFYSAEELATLTVARAGDSSVVLKTGDGRELGPFRFAHVVLP